MIYKNAKKTIVQAFLIITLYACLGASQLWGHDHGTSVHDTDDVNIPLTTQTQRLTHELFALLQEQSRRTWVTEEDAQRASLLVTELAQEALVEQYDMLHSGLTRPDRNQFLGWLSHQSAHLLSHMNPVVFGRAMIHLTRQYGVGMTLFAAGEISDTLAVLAAAHYGTTPLGAALFLYGTLHIGDVVGLLGILSLTHVYDTGKIWWRFGGFNHYVTYLKQIRTLQPIDWSLEPYYVFDSSEARHDFLIIDTGGTSEIKRWFNHLGRIFPHPLRLFFNTRLTLQEESFPTLRLKDIRRLARSYHIRLRSALAAPDVKNLAPHTEAALLIEALRSFPEGQKALEALYQRAFARLKVKAAPDATALRRQALLQQNPFASLPVLADTIRARINLFLRELAAQPVNLSETRRFVNRVRKTLLQIQNQILIPQPTMSDLSTAITTVGSLISSFSDPQKYLHHLSHHKYDLSHFRKNWDESQIPRLQWAVLTALQAQGPQTTARQRRLIQSLFNDLKRQQERVTYNPQNSTEWGILLHIVRELLHQITPLEAPTSCDSALRAES